MTTSSKPTQAETLSEKPSLASLLALAQETRISGIRVSLPAKVVAYDKERQCIDAQPLVDDRFADEQETMTSETLAPILDVPVVFKAGGGFYETFPIAVGDTVILQFCSSSIGRWKATGVGGDPGDSRRHHATDAVAFAGGRDFKHPLPNIPDDAWMIFVPPGKQMRLGGPAAAQSVPRGEALQSVINMIVSAISAGFAATTAPTYGAAGATAFNGALSGLPAAITAMLSQKIKVE